LGYIDLPYPRGVVLFVGTLAANDLISNAVTALPKNTFLVLRCELSGDWQILTELSHFRVLNILYFHYIPKCWESVVLDHTIDYNDKNI
jgi:hypothetical protein